MQPTITLIAPIQIVAHAVFVAEPAASDDEDRAEVDGDVGERGHPRPDRTPAENEIAGRLRPAGAPDAHPHENGDVEEQNGDARLQERHSRTPSVYGLGSAVAGAVAERPDERHDDARGGHDEGHEGRPRKTKRSHASSAFRIRLVFREDLPSEKMRRVLAQV